MSYRNKKLLDYAEGQPCTLCRSVGSTVACHANSVALGKGTGIKAPDYYVAYCCRACHDLIDGRTGKLDRAARQELWTTAHQRTVAVWFLEGVVSVRSRRP